MSTAFRFRHVDFQLPSQPEIVSLARKFYFDSRCQGGRDRQNQLGTEGTLGQRDLIECQTSSLHVAIPESVW